MSRTTTRTPSHARHLRGALLSLGLIVALAPAPARAEQESGPENFGVGIGAGICTLVYTPLKVVYAATGLPIGGLVYIWSVGDAEAAAYVIKRAATGDFVATPSHLRREQRLRFAGDAETPTPRASD